MTGAGELRDRFTVQRDMAEPDWTGHPGDPDWQDQFTVWGKITFMRGGETVIAARLTAKQPAILTIRISDQALTILPSDRIVDARTGEMFNIREQPRRCRDDPGLLEMLIEAGVT